MTEGFRARLACALFVCCVVLAACKPDPSLRPDEVLRSELGLTDRDAVHRVAITGGDRDTADPVETRVEPGAFVEFATGDWLVHEVIFELDSLGPEARAFLEDSDQVASPPLVQRDARFVVDFEGAPAGRYPFVLLGSGESGRGVVIVVPKP